ncbi:amidohydrolase family protein [Myxococcota bacterium]|nr:amidohydrolase family protein [Myxococcota bacterium]
MSAVRPTALVASLVLLVTAPHASHAERPARLPHAPAIVDAHVHVAPTELERLHDILDEVGIAWVLNLSGMWPGGLLERQLAAARRSGRILVACNLPWFAAAEHQDFPRLAAGLLEQSKALGARALKIEKGLGLHATKPDGTRLAVDDPWLDPIWAAAGRLGLPVVVHTGDPKAFWLPVDARNERIEELTAHPAWSLYGQAVPSFDALLAELMRVVERHPATTFVAVHFGNNAEDPEWVGAMLDRHPNLHVDLAARIPELGRHDPAKLRALFVRHASRIVYGSDLGVSPKGFLMLGSFGESPNTRDEVRPYFERQLDWLETSKQDIPSPTPIQGRWTIDGLALPDDVLAQIYVKNATRLFGPPPRLPPRFRGPTE